MRQNLCRNTAGNESLPVSTRTLTSDPAPGIDIYFPILCTKPLIATHKLYYFAILSPSDCKKVLRLRVNTLDSVHPLGVILTS